jgi:hypothetical protein
MTKLRSAAHSKTITIAQYPNNLSGNEDKFKSNLHYLETNEL